MASDVFHSKILMLQFTRHWPPCNFERPDLPMKLPFLLRWIDWLPSAAGLDDFKSFPGIRHTHPLTGVKKRKVGAWMVEPDEPVPAKKRRSVVMYFRGRSGHRGTRSRIRMYERLRKKPLQFHCAAFDGDDEELSNERGQLEDAHAVWSALTRPPYDFAAESLIIWGSALGCCSAANLCFYLMRRGTPPAALILENPPTSFPKLIASRFEFLGERVQNLIEEILKSNLKHRFDLEKRIRAICSFGIEVPLLLVSAEKDWTVPPSHAQRLADIASALAASKRVKLLTVPTSRQELVEHPHFFQVLSSFVTQALADAENGAQRRSRTISPDYVASPSTQADMAAEDRLFAMEEGSADISFHL